MSLATQITFQSASLSGAGLRYVKDSGVCETTPGVGQLSGYVDIDTNTSMYFWFFEARHEPETAPLTLWLSGGPGCSSMRSLFRAHGPCSVSPDGKTTTLNPFSWNNISNMIYIDQPIGAGFSRGPGPVNSTNVAAAHLWEALQVLFKSSEFSKFKTRDLLIGSESYGGHYGPGFVSYFNKQNDKIARGEVQGEFINVSALLVNNGWFDPLLQNKAYIDFNIDAPGYGQLQNATVIQKMSDKFYGPGGCKEQQQACYDAGDTPESTDLCKAADNYCYQNVLALAAGDRNFEDLRQPPGSPTYDPFPHSYYLDFLRGEAIREKIGAVGDYQECSRPVIDAFFSTGDDARTFLPHLGDLANDKMKILIWAGDTDINCNWLGIHESMLAMDWYGKEEFAKLPFMNMTINGKLAATVQNLDNFSFA
ncbi:hypothetical protein V5O48_007853 [Marasmius crinis-equi]|uniref:Carboxypeptidase n=1 Tax=Marasmius crinis-equi TaxID=585013 RepID=A0ABR3FFI0_9AGAR